MQSTLELEQVLQQICAAIVDSLEYENAVIWLHDEEKQVLRGAALHTKDSPQLIDRIEGIIGQKIIGLELPARRDYNLLVRRTLDGGLCLTHSLYELAMPLLDEVTCSAIQELIGAKTFIDIPMLAKGKVAGGLLITTSRDEVTKREIDSLTALVNQAGIAIENARLYGELRQAYQELEATQRELITLQRTTASIQTTLELDQILQQIADGIIEETIYNTSAIFLFHEDEGVFRLDTIALRHQLFAHVEKILGYKPTEFTIPADRDYSEAMRKVLSGQVVITHDLYEIAAPELSRATCSSLQELSGAKTIVAVPVIARGKVVGGLLAITQREAIPERRIESLVSFANQAASVLENAHLSDIERKEQQRNALLLAISHEFKVPLLQPTNIKVAIEEAVSLCFPFALSKKQDLAVEVPDSLPQVMLDRLQFERIITNLLTNATKFTPERGKIRLKARAEDDSLVVEVRDSGIGVSSSELERIFEPYYCGKASELSSTGLGLGLAIVKELVGMHRGKVWVESKPGKGSTFIFSLPLRTVMR